MSNQKTQVQELYSLFYGHDESRPAFKNPLSWQNKVYATDAHALIITDKENIDFEWKNEEKGHDLSTILPPENILKKIIIPDLEKYKTDDETKDIGENIKCSECEGEGEVEWGYAEWTKYFDCPKCYGTGYESESKQIPTGNKTYRNIFIKIKETYFQIKYFDKILKTQKLLGGDIYLISYTERRNCMFRIGKLEILLMAYAVKIESEKEIVVINIE